MELLSLAECRLVALRALQLQAAEEESLLVVQSQLDAGSTELMGYMGEYYKLHLQVKHAGIETEKHLQFFVKSVPHHNAPQREECERKGFFRKEATIYAEILPNIQKYANRQLFPKCYYSRQDIIVLEDLSQSFRHMKPTECYTLDHYKLVLEQLAALHAASIAWEEQEGFNIGDRYNDALTELLLSSQNEWFITGLKGIVFLAARHAKYQTDAAQKFIKQQLFQLLLETEHLVEPSTTMRNAFCHRDTWDRNIFFGFVASSVDSLPQSCCFVDFQLAKYCSPLLDVLFLLYIVPSASERLRIFDQCLEHYYKCLHSEFVRLGLPTHIISWETFLQESQRTRLAGLAMTALTEPQTKMSPEILNRLRAEEPEKFDYYLNCDRSELYLRVMQLQSGYEKVIMAPIEELIDYLMQQKSV
ncbi:hypothetical protein KR222_011761 [Zaprionus bogoriensis]|nr:hypothetical protein KR222_011761 [Zaprionus bogoriensis]